MNRRQLLAIGAVLPLSALPVAAQDNSSVELINRYLEMMSTQNWSIADEIFAESYAPLYPTSKTLPGREAWKQRQATQTLYSLFDSVAFTPVTIAIDGAYVHFLAEMQGVKHDGGAATVPLIGIFLIGDGIIIGGHGGFDDEVLFEQL